MVYAGSREPFKKMEKKTTNSPRMVLLKLGGSLITDKDVPLSINENALRAVGAAIRSSRIKERRISLFLVHGGGSFGHFYASKYHLSQTPKKVLPIGITRTCHAMLKLHSIVKEYLEHYGIATETILPSELLRRNLGSFSNPGRIHFINAVNNGLIPISFGYVGLEEDGAYVVSGDAICKAAVNSLKVCRTIFATDVDGIYPNSNLEGEIIRELSKDHKIITSKHVLDVTGGIRSKIKIGFELAAMGTEVFYVNGAMTGRLRNLIQGKNETKSTRIVNL
jgi:isopentenyl phosphate kinase